MDLSPPAPTPDAFDSSDMLVRSRSHTSIFAAAAAGAFSAGIFGIANDLVAVLALNADTTQIGVLNALESASYLFLAVPAGWFLDRFDRRRTLLLTQALSTLALLAIPVLWLSGILEFWQLAICSFIVGTASMLWGLGISTLLADVTQEERLASTFSRLQATQTSVGIVAPGVTGVLLMIIAAPITLFFAALFEILAGLLLVSKSSPTRTRSDDPASKGLKLFPGLKEGFVFAVRTKPIFMATIINAVSGASLAILSAVETVFFIRTLSFSPAVIGIVGVVISCAALCGALLGSWLLERYPPLPTACLASAVGTCSAVLLPISSTVQGFAGVPLIMVLSFNVLWNVSTVISNAAQFGVTAALTPKTMMGRVQSFRRLISMGPVPLFGLIGGWLGMTVGIVITLWIFVALAFIASVMSVLLWRVSNQWDIPSPNLS